MNLYAYVGNSPVNFIDPFGLLNPVKMGVGFTNATRGVKGLASGVQTLVTGTVAIPFTEGISGAVAYPIGIAQLASGVANLSRGVGQMREAHDELICQSSTKNILGLLPFGQKYDDDLEPGPKEYFSDIWNRFAADPAGVLKEAVLDFFAFN
jgi:type VI secretion system secreted protein VgrG